MELVIDSSAIMAIVMSEPEREALIAATEGAQLLTPPSLHWEVGNALAAMFRRGRIDLSQASEAIELYRDIPIRFADVELQQAVELAHRHSTYAYDAYILACALRYNSPLLSLDAQLNRVAEEAGISIWELE